MLFRSESQRADIVVAAVGRPGTVKAHHIRSGAVVVDVGINFEGGRMVGDVDFASVSPRAAAIAGTRGLQRSQTPVESTMR